MAISEIWEEAMRPDLPDLPVILQSAGGGLRQQHPEWRPWLRVVEAMLADEAIRLWDAARVDASVVADGVRPLLAGACVSVDPRVFRQLVQRLLDAGRALGAEARQLLEHHLTGGNAAALLAASLRGDRPDVRADSEGAVIAGALALLGVPVLQQVHRRHSSAGATWTQVYCPICAAWPAFVEVLGIERTRQARCGRCGAAWRAELLRCRYCASTDHRQLLTLTPQHGQASDTIEACLSCGKYTKVLTRLQGCLPPGAYLEDLATAELDLAALGGGYVRPQGLGFPLALELRVL
jgi:formate dehydrogenase maturation protein FdhE